MNDNIVKDMYHAKFSLDGVSCAACTSTIDALLQNSINGVDSESVKVSLLPSPTVELDYDYTIVKLSDIIEGVEEIGFGAELLDNSKKKDDNDDDDGIRMRTVRIEVECNSSKAKEYFEGHEAVDNVEDITMEKSKYVKGNNINGGGVLSVRYRDDICGVRTLIEGITTTICDNEEEEDHGLSCGFGSVKVVGTTNYQSDLESAELRRQSEINQWRNGFIFSAVFAIPIFIIAMILMKIPGPIQKFLMSPSVFNITWEELITWIMATPVQFISGYRFYRESYYQIKTLHLGMSVLIALGTSAAYFYSVFVVLYNAKNSGPRLMVAFESSALLICFVLLGKYLLANAKARTSMAISKLAHLTPEDATLVGTASANSSSLEINNCIERKIPFSLIQNNDILLVRPGEKIPSDGKVVHGYTSVDESMITGESIPKRKEMDDICIGGTINIDGAIQILVTNVGDDTTLAKIINLVQSAQNSKAPIQCLADYIAQRFTPFVLIVSLLTFVIWLTLLKMNVFSEEVKQSWHLYQNGFNDITLPILFSISVLVIACPCALGLATPTAVMVGTGVSARNGILMKGGEALESAQKVSAVVFDKTGTLTLGKPKVRDILLLSPLSGHLHLQGAADKDCEGKDDAWDDWISVRQKIQSKEINESSCCSSFHSNSVENHDVSTLIHSSIHNIILLAASAEHGSEHPIAKGILEKALEADIGNDKETSLLQVENFISVMGMGIQCTINNHSIHIGNEKILSSNQIKARPSTADAMKYLQKKGQTSVIVCIDGWTEAVIGLTDQPKDESLLAVKYLQSKHIKVYMLTGDNALTAKVVAKEVGIASSNVFSECLPEGKVDCLKLLQEKGEVVAMVGDGINDSPALAQADLGIAIGSGTDVAIETASIVLVNSKVTDVCIAIDIAKTIYNRIKINFFWALGYNTVAIPFAAGAFFPLIKIAMPPYMAAIAMACSSISVLISSLLLNRYQPPDLQQILERNSKKRSNNYPWSFISPHGSQHVILEASQQEIDGEILLENHSQVVDNRQGVSQRKNYPGCQASWGKPCVCSDCKCLSCGSSTSISCCEE